MHHLSLLLLILIFIGSVERTVHGFYFSRSMRSVIIPVDVFVSDNLVRTSTKWFASFPSKTQKYEDDFFSYRPQSEEEMRIKAHEVLDCLACPYNIEDPDYDHRKARRRDTILKSIDYADLKIELMKRGLSKTGEKVEMLTRLLLHVIDPSIDYTARYLSNIKSSNRFPPK